MLPLSAQVFVVFRLVRERESVAVFNHEFKRIVYMALV